MTQTLTGRRSRDTWTPLPTPPAADVLDADLEVRVAAAALAEHPGATVGRVEVDGEGRYAAHLVTWFGQQVVVPVDRDLTVMGWAALAR
ncbi:hypothetical protein SAMN05660642_03353 [Geodermatophilus siccatus]|uniref:Uncharacterized protein n=1 Tax=Geodermatophilus siccatus TaxID=1137991 RepID=A0A1G9WEH3_9ACTN|nr:hypothetical protein [Geodermatophilus siccatus]SDM82576.1 hypothetical protein SAMN05660642_03353 [Geodermatophilus siccatus]